jgi:YVTN family beta-propeller protein
MKKVISSLAAFALLTFCLQLRADSVLTSIAAGNELTGIAVNPVTNKIYVAVDAAGQLAVIDGKTNKVTTTLTIGSFAIAVAVNPVTNRVYASSCNSTDLCHISVIDGRNDTLITKIPVASGSFIGIQGMAVNPITNRIYASDADNGQYIVIDGKTNTIITQVPVFTQPGGMAVDPKTNHLFVVGAGFPGQVQVFDGDTNAQIAVIPEAFGSVNVATNFRLDRAYVTVNSTVSVIDGATNTEVAEVPAGTFANGVDVNLLNSKVYVVNSASQNVTIIEGKTNHVLQTLPIPAVSPNSVAVNPVNGRAYISDFNSGGVIVLQPK